MYMLSPITNVDLTRSVLKTPVAPTEFCELLRQALEQEIPTRVRRNSRIKQVEFNDKAKAIEHFGRYLESLSVSSVMPNEELVFGFLDHLLRGGTPKPFALKLVQHIRNLTNSLPRRIVQRQLVTHRTYLKVHRFDALVPETKQILDWFLRDGRRIKGGIFSPDLLSEGFRERVVAMNCLLLHQLGKKDLRELTKEDAEMFILQYVANGHRRESAINILIDARHLFLNLVARGTLKSNPFADYTRKVTNVNSDYIRPNGMTILQNLKNVNMDDFYDVRDRLIAFGLCYDFALRIGEVARLRMGDIEMGEGVGINLRGEIQKGYKKPEAFLGNEFEETKVLFARYLELREQIGSASDALILSMSGEPMLDTGCRDAVKALCEKLDVRTVGGHIPTPHRLRHTFGTLNIEPLGAALSIYEIAEKLRHTDLDTTRRIYITNNTELQRARHTSRIRKKRHQSTAATIASNPDWTESVSEPDAQKQTQHLGVAPAAFRDFALNSGHARDTDGEVVYSASFLKDLKDNWLPKAKAMRVGKYTKSGFFYIVAARKLRYLKIGRIHLYRRADVGRR